VEPAVTPADAMRSNMVLTRIDDLEAKVDNLTAVLKSMTVRIAALPIEFRDAVVALLK
jgi:predicted DNA-binding ribbon-helix-helix protein